MRLEYTTVSATGPERRRQTASIRRCNLLGQAATQSSVRIPSTLCRIFGAPNDLRKLRFKIGVYSVMAGIPVNAFTVLVLAVFPVTAADPVA